MLLQTSMPSSAPLLSPFIILTPFLWCPNSKHTHRPMTICSSYHWQVHVSPLQWEPWCFCRILQENAATTLTCSGDSTNNLNTCPCITKFQLSRWPSPQAPKHSFWPWNKEPKQCRPQRLPYALHHKVWSNHTYHNWSFDWIWISCLLLLWPGEMQFDRGSSLHFPSQWLWSILRKRGLRSHHCWCSWQVCCLPHQWCRCDHSYWHYICCSPLNLRLISSLHWCTGYGV